MSKGRGIRFESGDAFLPLVAVIIAGVMLWPAANGCTDDEGARRVLAQQGLEDVEVTGWTPFVCGKRDAYATGFKATNARGDRVEGVVCCGWPVKGCTVRW